ncbi:hypothetical protein Naga_100673g1 [Nannochloropsis gaditana]|uniref:VOC domain-containing protein n=1 Tax=Nannochloropsis gaditana TaxID=72520 RepID=W7T7Q9_9STRA|nr:hypothetical protein Naga_100673g1 [Nannochloropsis gaditana]
MIHFLVVPAHVACFSRPQVTFIQGDSKDVLSSVTLRVFDTEKAVAFYNKLGMKVLKKHANVPPETSISTWVGYDDDHIYTMGFVHEKLKQPQFHMMRVPATALLLNYEYDSQPVKTGNSLAHIVVGTNKGVKTALDSIAAEGAKVLKEVSTEDGQDVAAVADMDGYTLTLVDMEEINAQLAKDEERRKRREALIALHVEYLDNLIKQSRILAYMRKQRGNAGQVLIDNQI